MMSVLVSATVVLGAALAVMVHARARAQDVIPETARAAALLSRVVYWGSDRLRSAGAEVHDDAATGARVALVEVPPGRLYVCFCGTDGPRDVARALDVMPVETELGVTTHHGFYEQFRALRDRVERALTNASEVVFCGHSMGAAIAAIAALHLREKIADRRVSCFMFGCPVVGDVRFKDAFDRACPDAWRFSSPRDPFAVSAVFNPTFVHVGRSVYIDPYLRDTYSSLPLLHRASPPGALSAAHHLLLSTKPM